MSPYCTCPIKSPLTRIFCSRSVPPPVLPIEFSPLGPIWSVSACCCTCPVVCMRMSCTHKTSGFLQWKVHQTVILASLSNFPLISSYLVLWLIHQTHGLSSMLWNITKIVHLQRPLFILKVCLSSNPIFNNNVWFIHHIITLMKKQALRV